MKTCDFKSLAESKEVYKQSLKTCLIADAFKSLAESKEVYKQSLKTCLKADAFKSLAESKEVYKKLGRPVSQILFW